MAFEEEYGTYRDLRHTRISCSCSRISKASAANDAA